jgi:hypothetical protein
MTFDKPLFALFAQWPDAAYLLCGETPPAGVRFSAPVIKAVERRLDGLLEPAIPPHRGASSTCNSSGAKMSIRARAPIWVSSTSRTCSAQWRR